MRGASFRCLESLNGKLSVFINCNACAYKLLVLATRSAFADDYDAFCFIVPLLLEVMLMQTLTTFYTANGLLFSGSYGFSSIGFQEAFVFPTWETH